MPRNGWHFPFSFFAAQSSRSKTEFIGFAGSRARTEPRSGPLFRFLPAQGSRSKTESIGFAGSRARTEPGPGPLFHFLPAQGSRTKTEFIGFAGSRARTPRGPGSIFLFSRHKVRARKPNPLALRTGEREPHRGPGRLFCSLVDRNRRKGLSYICRKMCRLGFQKIFCRYSNFSGLCCRNSSEGLFNDFSKTFQVRATF